MWVSDMSVRQWSIEQWGRRLLDELAAIERALWVAVVVTLLADVYLTHLGLQYGLREGNPIARYLIEAFGIVALAGVKVGVVGLAGLVRELVPPRQAATIPLGLVLPWLVAVLVNATLLLGR